MSKVFLAAAAIVKDELSILPEWLSFHRHQGVERFFIYENGSTDGSHEFLAAEQDVKLIPWLQHPGQLPAYSHLIRTYEDAAEWIAVIDADEFLYSPVGWSLPSAIALLADARTGGLVVNWRVFGATEQEVPPEGVVHGLHRRASSRNPINHHVKTIVRPERAISPHTPHAFIYANGYHAVGEHFDVVRGPFRDPSTTEILRCNHYFTRSLTWARAKAARGRSDTGTQREVIELLDPSLTAIDDDRSILAVAP